MDGIVQIWTFQSIKKISLEKGIQIKGLTVVRVKRTKLTLQQHMHARRSCLKACIFLVLKIRSETILESNRVCTANGCKDCSFCSWELDMHTRRSIVLREGNWGENDVEHVRETTKREEYPAKWEKRIIWKSGPIRAATRARKSLYMATCLWVQNRADAR